MKATIFASFVLGVMSVGALPSADHETFTDNKGNTIVGADKVRTANPGSLSHDSFTVYKLTLGFFVGVPGTQGLGGPLQLRQGRDLRAPPW